MAARRARYRLTRAMRYQAERPDGTRGTVVRRDAGDIVTDLPSGSIAWLLEQGLIEPARRAKPGEGATDGHARQ